MCYTTFDYHFHVNSCNAFFIVTPFLKIVFNYSFFFVTYCYFFMLSDYIFWFQVKVKSSDFFNLIFIYIVYTKYSHSIFSMEVDFSTSFFSFLQILEHFQIVRLKFDELMKCFQNRIQSFSSIAFKQIKLFTLFTLFL